MLLMSKVYLELVVVGHGRSVVGHKETTIKLGATFKHVLQRTEIF